MLTQNPQPFAGCGRVLGAGDKGGRIGVAEIPYCSWDAKNGFIDHFIKSLSIKGYRFSVPIKTGIPIIWRRPVQIRENPVLLKCGHNNHGCAADNGQVMIESLFALALWQARWV